MVTDSTGVLSNLETWRDRLTMRLQAGRSGPLFRALRGLLTAVILGLLAVQLTHVGWGAIFRALPTHPLFYVLLLLAYVALPATEVLIYRPLWHVAWRPLFLACARKRVLNEEVLGYSGEVSLYLWAASTGIETGLAFRTVRDVNIVSSFVSFAVAGVLIGVMAAVGGLDLSQWVNGRGLVLLGGAVILGGTLIFAFRFRRYVFAFPHREAARVAVLHLARHLATNAALIAMWHLAQPGVSLAVWLALAGLLVVVERLPFLPSRDLVFVGASVELSKTMSVATAAMAAMLLVQSVGFKLLHLVVFAAAPLGLRRAVAKEQELTITQGDKTSSLLPSLQRKRR